MTPPPAVLVLGNPLLDLSTTTDAEYLAKFGLESGSACLAEDKHMPIFQELTSPPAGKEVGIIAGGAAMNSARGLAWMGQTIPDGPIKVYYVGSVGKDDVAATLRRVCAKDKVTTLYHETDEAPTGRCACLILDKERTLVAHLAAAERYKPAHFQSEEVQTALKEAQFVYASGFFLSSSAETLHMAGKHCADTGARMLLNLSAPFIAAVYKDQLDEAVRYADYVFCNHYEVEAYAKAHQTDAGESPSDLARFIARMPKARSDRPRVVVVTQGAKPTLVCEGDGPVREVPVPAVPPAEIVDVNGAGDAFVGGFLSQLVVNAPLERCAEAGNYCAGYVIRRSGSVYEGTPTWK